MRILSAGRTLFEREKTENELLKQQNAYYRARYEEYEKKWAELGRLRHDMRNQYALEMTYLQNGQYEKLYKLYVAALDELKTGNTIVSTGNIGVDSILNYKITVAQQKEICVEKDIKAVGKITIDDRDMNRLVGNLFDNAIEAVGDLETEQKKIYVKLRADKAAFLLVVKNPYQGERRQQEAEMPKTTKKDKKNHGIGLKVVNDIIKKYHGKLEIKDEENVFSVSAFLYM